ncbi:MAG: DUF115 domain-containing protein [Leptospirales bacterium]|nr:DUF115 domain-containing protein [Leptospirales bacterium]
MHEPQLIAEILRRKPYLLRYLQADSAPRSAEAPAESYQLRPTRAGEAVPVLVRREGEQFLASRYDLRREAERMLPPQEARMHRAQIVVLLGLANPLAPLLMLERMKEQQILLVLEQNLRLAQLVATQYPGFEALLLRPNAHLFAGEDGLQLLDQYLEALPADSLSGIRFVRHPATQRADADYYERAERRIRSLLRSRMSDLLTRFEFEQSWIANIVINSRLLPPQSADRPAATVGAFAGALAGMPGVVVSTGPSLRSSLPLLARLKERAFILACDASLKPMLRYGLAPHGVITLDAQKHTLRHLAGEERLSECLLFADLVASPFTLRALHAQRLIFSTTTRITAAVDGRLRREDTPGAEHAERLHGPIGGLQSGGSVATTAFDLLRNLGCDPIILIGQDLAYTGRKIHCSGTHHTERWLAQLGRTLSFETINERIVRRRETMPVTAMDGEQTLGDFVLSLYRQWFEESAARLSIRLVNLSAAGAHIEGFEEPTNREAFVDSLPLLHNPARVFLSAPPMEHYEHPENRRLYRLARRAAAAEADRETLFSEFPMTRRLIRRAEIYIKRNQEKLGAERATQVYERYAGEALRRFERRLRPYFGDDAETGSEAAR